MMEANTQIKCKSIFLLWIGSEKSTFELFVEWHFSLIPFIYGHWNAAAPNVCLLSDTLLYFWIGMDINAIRAHSLTCGELIFMQ